MKSVPTFTATIYVGTKVHETGESLPIDLARQWLQKHCDEFPICVTLTETEYIYANGNERGFSVGLINYPRFPSDPETIQERARTIAKELLGLFKQGKVSIVFPAVTEMYESFEG
jgi:hypothetical protein